MHNILVFGLERRLGEIRACFSGRSTQKAKIFSADSLTEFKTTAFSRVFDLWLINGRHPDSGALPLKHHYSIGTPPFVFLVQAQNTVIPARFDADLEVTVLPETSGPPVWVKRFYQMDITRQAQRRENFLAGIIEPRPGLETLVSQSPSVLKLIDLIKDIAPTRSALLLLGETGTGKELFATILHNESQRRAGPFMAVNCGALPDTLLESELFGYEKGAFTGAAGRRTGKIEHSSSGTLFLDEIETMSEAMQVKLLRVLQEKSLQRLGGNVEIATDFRLIVATNRDPQELLASGKLRSDLYYRIAVFPIRIPPLRERREDIGLLATHFLNKKKRDGRDYVQGIDSTAMKRLNSSFWEGNIRELQNVIERAVMLADTNMITGDLIEIASPADESTAAPDSEAKAAFKPGVALKTYRVQEVKKAERRYLIELLNYTGGRVGEAARYAGLTPRALYNKMQKYRLKKEYFKRFRG